MKRVCVFAIVVATVLPGAAIAQNDVNDGPYFRVGVGASFASDLEQDIVRNLNPNIVGFNVPVNAQNVALSQGLTGAVALGFDYADGIRTELEYRYAMADIEQITPSGGFNVNPNINPNAPVFPDEKLKAHFLMSNFYFDFANESPFAPFIGGGVGGAFITNETGETDAALALQGRAGIAIDLGGGLTTDVEYIYMRTNELVFGSNPEDFNPQGPFGGSALVGDRYQSSSVMVSFRKKF